MDSETAAIEIVARYLDAMNRGDVEAMVACTSPEYEYRTPRWTARGHEEMRAAMAEPRSVDAVFVPERWFVRAGQVVCLMLGRFTWAETGEVAGEEPRFMRAVVNDGQLELVEVGFADADAALAAAGLQTQDERQPS
jgi:ketosteroid isomerase-like protein